MSCRGKLFVLLLCLTLALALGPASVLAEETLTVFGAASTTNALEEAGQAFTAQSGIKVVNSFASSSTLAKQIEQGAPAGVYVSANVKWMDYLAKKGLIVDETRVNLLRNRVVLIVPADSPLTSIEIGPGFDLAAKLGQGRLAMGDPEHVPAGMYGKEALVNLGVWPQVADKIAAAANVRVALALVERGEAPLGLVYSTDAKISQKVKVVGLFPADSHRPIVYPAAVIKAQDSQAARLYLKFLASAPAAQIFTKHGFAVGE